MFNFERRRTHAAPAEAMEGVTTGCQITSCIAPLTLCTAIQCRALMKATTAVTFTADSAESRVRHSLRQQQLLLSRSLSRSFSLPLSVYYHIQHPLRPVPHNHPQVQGRLIRSAGVSNIPSSHLFNHGSSTTIKSRCALANCIQPFSRSKHIVRQCQTPNRL